MLKLQVAFYKIFYRPIFIIIIEQGIAKKIYGIVKQNFLHDCQDVATDEKIQSGIIYCSKSNKRLFFSNSINNPAQQKFRNSWSFCR